MRHNPALSILTGQLSPDAPLTNPVSLSVGCVRNRLSQFSPDNYLLTHHLLI
ncbi:hypothetical protein NIES39_D06250 [Arthrospira platensis NIES-39]|nr:hypothetical protein NIES39_D06250 [Arthrospira platensis NIES-39]